MLSFYEYMMTEAVNKKPTFKSVIKDIYETSKLVKGFSVEQKIVFTTVNKREYAKFELAKRDFARYKGDQRDADAMHTWNRGAKETGRKLFNGFLAMFGCPKSAMNNVQDVSVRTREEILKIQFKDSNGFDWILIGTISVSPYGDAHFSLEVEVYGNVVTNQKEEVFEDYPKFVPGAILWHQFGYSMTINQYYIIESREKKTIFCREIGSKVVDGQAGYYGHEVPNTNDKDSKLFKCILRNGERVKVDGNDCSLWNGQPNYFNRMD